MWCMIIDTKREILIFDINIIRCKNCIKDAFIII